MDFVGIVGFVVSVGLVEHQKRSSNLVVSTRDERYLCQDGGALKDFASLRGEVPFDVQEASEHDQCNLKRLLFHRIDVSVAARASERQLKGCEFLGKS